MESAEQIGTLKRQLAVADAEFRGILIAGCDPAIAGLFESMLPPR